MFLPRRKLVGAFSVLIFFGMVATINHYFYLSPASSVTDSSKTKPRLEEGEVPHKHLEVSALQAEVVINEASEHDLKHPEEVAVADEIRHAFKTRRVEFVSGPKKGNGLSLPSKAKGPAADTVDISDEHLKETSADGNRYLPRRKVVHFDLKGAPPKLTFLKSLFPLLENAGATHLLMEYEDMFPFWGELRNISARNAYSKADIQTIHKMAKKSHLEIIPLVQTFGHLEFVLKLEEFKNLRDDPESPQAICPCEDKSFEMVKSIIDQVLELHPDSRWLHIGCDEVFQLAECQACTDRINKANADPAARYHFDGKSIFLDHVSRLGNYVRNEKKVIPIIWDDMLRTIPTQIMMDSGIGRLVEPMIWVYIEDIDRFIDPITWSAYAEVFTHAWTASAYKGAFGERLYLTNIYRHVGNHLAWLSVMRRESGPGKDQLSFRGIALTGWSRYDHFAVLCELLPNSVPSLVLNLVILGEGEHSFEATRKAHRLLQCSSQKVMMTPEELQRNNVQSDLHRCRFPGSNLLSVLGSYDLTKREVEGTVNR